MKKLAKLTAVFTVICMALALVACGHSGSDYDWKNPEDTEGGSGGGDEEPEIVLSYTDSWNGGSNVFTLYDDYTYTLEKYYGGTITSDSQKGTWEKTESGYKLTAKYYWDTSEKDWAVSTGSYGYTLTVDDNGNVTGYNAWY